MKLFSAIFPVLLLLGSPAAATEQEISGQATVIDGDTLDIQGTRIRLFAIDAPEAAQTCSKAGEDWQCGQDATAFMRELAEGKAVKCLAREVDVYGQFVAVCHQGDLDVGLTMIEAGLAVSRRNSPEHYLQAEGIRKTYKIGLWASEFQTPAEYRAANPASSPKPRRAFAQTEAPDRAAAPVSNREYRNKWGCAIKGNRNRKGQWIYHLPGRPHYERTRAEELFCTEAQARAAGYRRSKA